MVTHLHSTAHCRRVSTHRREAYVACIVTQLLAAEALSIATTHGMTSLASGRRRSQAIGSWTRSWLRTMMLRLHQSATDPGGEWHEGADGITRPGLVLWGRDDPFAAMRFTEHLARLVNAELPSL